MVDVLYNWASGDSALSTHGRMQSKPQLLGACCMTFSVKLFNLNIQFGPMYSGTHQSHAMTRTTLQYNHNSWHGRQK